MKNKRLELFLIAVCFLGATGAAGVLIKSAMGLDEKVVVATNTLEEPPAPLLKTQVEAPKVESSEVVVLSDKNSTTMDQVFDDDAVQKVMQELQALSDKLSKSATIYLVMNTPGGSVDAGLKLITFAKALPQKIKTVTIFAASMGFQTVQQLDERLILANGTLMSHPASFGVRGATPEQVANRTKWIMSMINALDQASAERMGMSFKDYHDLVHDEYWVYDANAVKERAADRKVLAKCGSYAEKTKWKSIDTIFGTFQIEIASCPLIPGILSVKAPANATNEAVRYVKLMLSNRNQFTKEYIVTNKYWDFQN